MKKFFLTLFFIIILLSFAPKVQAGYHPVSWSGGVPYVASIPPTFNCMPDGAPPTWCPSVGQFLQNNLNLVTTIATLPNILPTNTTYTTDGYNVGVPYDAVQNDYSNTKLVQSPIPMGNVTISTCNIDAQCLSFPPFNVSCAPPNTTTYFGYSRQSGGGQRVGSCAFLGGTGAAAYWEYVTNTLPLTTCEFGSPSGNQMCPDLPNITAPVSVPSGTPATISWTAQQTVIPGTGTNFISSCTITSSPSVGGGAGLSGSISPVLNSATIFTLTCTDFFGPTYTTSKTVNVVPVSTLSINSINPNSGVSMTGVTVDFGGLGNGSTSFTRTYNTGASVSATAPATASGNNFSSWTGCDLVTGTYTCNVTMSANRTVMANYVTPTFSLTVNSTNPNSGVSMAGVTIDNGGLGNGSTSFVRVYNGGTAVTITAPANASGNVFNSWTACDSVVGNTCNITLNVNRTVTANYVAAPAIPTVTDSAATSITTTSATLNAQVTSLGIPAAISARGICYSVNPAPSLINGASCNTDGAVTLGAFTRAIAGLTPGTTYYYRGYATNLTGTGYSVGGSFVAVAATVSVVASTPYNVTPGANVSFAYVPNTNTGTTECLLLDNTLSPLTAYQPSSPIVYPAPVPVNSYGYYVQCRNVAYPAVTANSGQIIVNVSLAPVSPTVTDSAATSITTTSATLNAQVTSLGIPAAISARGICYSVNPAPSLINGASCNTDGAVTLGAFTRAIAGLTPGTTYYYRGYATNLTGTGYSVGGSFTSTAPPVTYDLQVNSQVSNNVPITVAPGSSGPTPLTNTYNNGTAVSITAPATASGNNFSNWGVGDCDSFSGTNCNVTMNSPRTVRVVYTSPNVTVSVHVQSVHGSVTSSPFGIDCGATCSATYTAGTPVTLTAHPNVNREFLGWSGVGLSCNGGNLQLTCTFNADNLDITANFAITPGYKEF